MSTFGPENKTIADLLEIMKRLRDPVTGCPWDRAQNFESIAPYTLEEAYEVAEAIAEKNWPALCEELGDLLLQVIFHSQMAEEKGYFSFSDVLNALAAKLVRRHPHVFASSDSAGAPGGARPAPHSPEDVKGIWEQIKAEERAEKSQTRPVAAAAQTASILDNVPRALPALSRAVKLQHRAARVGFDWPSTDQVIEKLNEEMLELAAELAACRDRARIADELGDLLFVYANLARHLDIDPEQALQNANRKFITRFRYIEDTLQKEGKTLAETSLEEMDRLWNAAKSLKSEPAPPS